MIFCHKPYYNLDYTNPNQKKVIMIYVLNPKNYTNYTNYIMQNQEIKNNIVKKIKNKNLKLLNYKYLLTKRKYLNLYKKSNKFCTKPKENMSFTFVQSLQPTIFNSL
jgi:hypothetical protein